MDLRKKNNKNCMILHCKNAEINDNNIVISAFLQCKIIQFLLFFFEYFIFFLNLAVFYIGENKKSQKYLFLFFSKMQKFGSEDP